MDKKLIGFFLALVGIAGPATAQVVNGEFDLGPASWTWKNAVFSTMDFSTCDAEFVTVTGNWNHTPTGHLGSDRAARVSYDPGPITGNYYGCREIEQQVYVPVGTQLKFSYQLGTKTVSPYTNYIFNPVDFRVTVEDVQLGAKSTLMTDWGESCDHPMCEIPIETATLDMSRYWGRTIILRFRSVSMRGGSGIGTTDYPSPAFVDSIRLETPTLSIAKPKAGSYYNSTRSGQGLHLSKAPDGQYSLLWYTFLPNGQPVWYMSDLAFHVNGVWQSPLYHFTWNAATGQRNPGVLVGDVRIESTSSGSFNFLWDFHADGNAPGYDGGEPMAFLKGAEGYTGMWYEPTLGGWGFSIDHDVGDFAGATVFYYDGSAPVWAYGELKSPSADPIAGVTATLTRWTSTGLCPQCRFEPVKRTAKIVGQMGFRLDAYQGWFNATGDSTNWSRGTSAQPANLYRLTYP